MTHLQALCGLLFPMQQRTQTKTNGLGQEASHEVLQQAFLRSGHICPLLHAVDGAYQASASQGGERPAESRALLACVDAVCPAQAWQVRLKEVTALPSPECCLHMLILSASSGMRIVPVSVHFHARAK